MLKTLNVPTSNISTLKKNPTKIFDNARNEKTGVYIFNRNTPAGIVMSVNDYENMVKKINQLEDKILDLQVEENAAQRVQNYDGIRFSDEEVRGKELAHRIPTIDENDGWE